MKEKYEIKEIELPGDVVRFYSDNAMPTKTALPVITSIDVFNKTYALSFKKNVNFLPIYNLLNKTKTDYSIHENGQTTVYLKSNIIMTIVLLRDMYINSPYYASLLLEKSSLIATEWEMDNSDQFWRHKIQLSLLADPIPYSIDGTECLKPIFYGIEALTCRGNEYSYYDEKKITHEIRREIRFKKAFAKRNEEKKYYLKLSKAEKDCYNNQEFYKAIVIKKDFYFGLWSVGEFENNYKNDELKLILNDQEQGMKYLANKHPHIQACIKTFIKKINMALYSKANSYGILDNVIKFAKSSTGIIGSGVEMISDAGSVFGGAGDTIATMIYNLSPIKMKKEHIKYLCNTAKFAHYNNNIFSGWVVKDISKNNNETKSKLIHATIWQSILCNSDKYMLLSESGVERFVKVFVNLMDEAMSSEELFLPDYLLDKFSNQSYVSLDLGLAKEWGYNLHTNNNTLMTVGELLSSYDRQICHDTILGDLINPIVAE